MEILPNIDPGPNDENYLWRQLLSGDKTALARIMHCYADPLFSYGIRFSVDKTLVEDCIQDLFVEIWKRKEFLAATVHLKSYLFSSLRRMILRKSKGLKKVRLLSLDPDDLTGFNFEFSIDNTIIKKEETKIIAQKLQQMITALPKRQKEIVYLKFFENLDRDEIGDIMQISPQAVSNLLQKALKRLRAGSDIITLALTALLIANFF